MLQIETIKKGDGRLQEYIRPAGKSRFLRHLLPSVWGYAATAAMLSGQRPTSFKFKKNEPAFDRIQERELFLAGF